MINMAKRRKRTQEKDLDEDDLESEKYDKKPKGRKRSSRSRETTDINTRKEAIVIFGIAAILIGAVLGGYYAYAYILYPEENDTEDGDVDASYGVKLEVINHETHNFGASSSHKAHMGLWTQYLLLVTNKGTVTDTIKIQLSDPPAGWAYELDEGHKGAPEKLDSSNNIRLASKGAEVLRLKVLVPEQLESSISTQVTAYSMADTSKKSTIDVRTRVANLGDETAEDGDNIKVYYTLVDRGVDDNYNKNVWAFNQANEFPFTIGTGVIEGFSEMAKGMRKGQTKVWKIPVELCYYNPDPKVMETDTKPDGPLMYEMKMMDLDA